MNRRTKLDPDEHVPGQLAIDDTDGQRLRLLSLFSGYGGLDMAVAGLLGAEVIAHAEVDPGASCVLAHRYPQVLNLGDVTAIDWPTLGRVDVLTGGFPCQDVSLAGRRLGIAHDTRSGLWAHMAAAVDELRPALVVIENVRGLLSARADHPAHDVLEPCPWCMGDGAGVPLRALGAVLGDLADLGYDAAWQVLSAADVGAPHRRERVFVVAWPAGDVTGDAGRLVHRELRGVAADPDRLGHERGRRTRHGRTGPADSGRVAAHPDGDAVRGQSVSVAGRGGPAVADHVCADAAADAVRSGRNGRTPDPVGLAVVGTAPARRGEGDSGPVAWGPYAAAVHRWEHLTRPAPPPTEPGRNGQPRLSPRFVEWLMGLPAGWVTDVPGVTRNDALRLLGNGVVPQQAAAAVASLLAAINATAPPSEEGEGAA